MPLHPIEGRKIKVKQHIPGFVQGYEPEIHHVESPDKVLKAEFLEKKWINADGFLSFAMSQYIEDTYLLIGLFADGKHHVAAYVEGLTEEEAFSIAPKWQPPPQEKKEEKHDAIRRLG